MSPSKADKVEEKKDVIDDEPEQEDEGSSTMLYIGLAMATAAAGGLAFYLMN